MMSNEVGHHDIVIGKYQQSRRAVMKRKCLDYLGGKKCHECGKDWLPEKCYHFHHRNNKKYDISYMIARNMEWNLIKEELNKCDVLCPDCHGIKHCF